MALCLFGPIPSRALAIHFPIPKLEKAGFVHDLPPTAAPILGRQLIGIPFCNPSSSSSDRRPLVDSQLICRFTQCANNSGCGPIHRAIRRYAVDHQIAEGIGLGKLRRQTTGLIHVLRPASQLLKVLIDATVGRHQGLLRTTASVQTPKVVLVDKVVHQVVPQQKPIDLFKIKSKDKGKPEHEARLAAYGALVVTQQRAGLYSMPCAAAVLA